MVGNAGELSATATLDNQWSPVLKEMLAQVRAMGQKTAAALEQIGKKVDASLTKPFKNLNKTIWNVHGNIKDIFRVATGILMARAINTMLRNIVAAVRALAEFNSLLETTQISFRYLMQISREATNVILEQLKELAARTPYTYETAIKAAQRMLALGFDEKQLLPMLRMMADLNAATGGGAEQMEALAYAFGKVQAMGKMTTRELRLFVSANIPIYKILREELGLTAKDFVKLRLSASEAIPAILRGIQKFRGAAAELERTIPGLISSIHDYLLFIAHDITKSIWESLREVLIIIRERLAEIREIFQKQGIAGLIAALFPRSMRQTIAIVVNSISSLAKSIFGLITAFGPAIKVIAEFGARILTYVLPPIVWLIDILKLLINDVLRASGFIKVLVGVLGTLGIAVAVAGFIGMLSKAIVFLGIAQGVSVAVTHLATAIRVLYIALSSHPIVAIITAIAGAIVYLGISSAWGAKMLDNVQRKIADFFGVASAIDSVTTSAKETSNAFGGVEMSFQDLINSFADVGDGTEEAGKKIKEVGDKAEKAGKKIKDTFLASFDEVYQIPDKLEEAGAVDLDLGDLGAGIDLGGLGGLGIDFGDIKDTGKRTVEELWTGIVDGIRTGKGLKLTSMLADALDKSMNEYWEKGGPPPLEEDLFSFIWRKLKEFGENVKSMGLGKALLEWIGWDTFVERFKGSSEYWKGLWEKIKGWAIWEWLRNVDDLVKKPFNWLEENIFRRDMTVDFKRMWSAIQNWAIWDWFKNISNWAIWEWFKNIANWTIWNPETWVGYWKAIQNWAIWDWFKNISNWAIWGWFKNIANWTIWNPETWVGYWKAIQNWAIWDWFKNISNWAIWEWFKNILPKFDVWKAQWMIDFKDAIIGAWEGIATGIKKPLNAVIRFINYIIKAIETGINNIFKGLRKIEINVPAWAQKFTGTAKYGLPVPDNVSLGRIAELAAGGIVTQDTVAQLGENNRPEAVTPLSAEGIKPWAEAIVNAIQPRKTTEPVSDYVLVRLKKSDLINLERQLFTVRKGEAFRIAGRA